MMVHLSFIIGLSYDGNVIYDGEDLENIVLNKERLVVDFYKALLF